MKKTLGSLKARLRPSGPTPTNLQSDSKSKQVLRVTLNAAEISVRLLKELSDTIPFIGIAASGVVFIIEQSKKYAENSQSFQDLLSSVESLDRVLSPYKNGGSTVTPEVRKIMELFDNNRILQFINTADNESRVASLIQKVKEAIDRIMIANLLEISSGVQEAIRGIKAIGTVTMVAVRVLVTNNARYDCIDRDQCLDGTRVSVLDDIQTWFKEGNEQVYWLNGAAGMGKTTVALSIAHRLGSDQDLLLASFFCSRESADRKNPNLIFPTIACQLASWSQEFQDALVETVARHPYLGSALPHEQFQRLIADPLKSLNTPTSIALIIDALDECEGERTSEKFLLAILRHVHLISSLKVLVSCRPAAYVENLLSSGDHRRMLKLHHVPRETVNDDFRLYYRQRLEEISAAKKLDWTDHSLDGLVQKLVDQAEGLFIYAVTVCNYIDSRGDVRRQLEHITSLYKGEYDSALSIDMLYTEVLSAALQKIPESQDRRDFARVLASVVHAQQPLTMNALGQLLDIKPSNINDLLRDVHSILLVPDDLEAFSKELVHTFHASFPDYLVARDRVGLRVPSLYVPSSLHHTDMTLCCLRCLNRELKRITPYSDSLPSAGDTSSHPLQADISEALRYAIIYWADHFWSVSSDELRVREEGDLLLHELLQFTSKKLLFWFECICLLDASALVVKVLLNGKMSLTSLLATKGLQRHPALRLLDDAYHAANEFFPIFRPEHAQQIYLTFLLFLPQNTSIFHHYSHYLPPGWKVTGQQRRTWNPLVRSLDLSPFSDTVAFSPDEGNILDIDYLMSSANILSSATSAISQILPSSPVSGAWDYEKIPGVDAPFPAINSDNLQPGMVSTVWLPSGTIVTCCTLLSDIKMPFRSYSYISLWDSETGAHTRLLYKSMEGANMFLPVIKASPNFCYVGYSSPSVQIVWNTATWEEIIFSSSHTRSYRCFALSNSHYLIGSELRELTSETALVSELDMDPQQVASCVFSLYGQALALCLVYGVIQIWSVTSRSQMVASYQFPSFADYSNSLPIVAFSQILNSFVVCFGPELHLLSMADKSIHHVGPLNSPYPAHLRAVSFSPKSQFIACRDNNGMVHVWSSESIVDYTNSRDDTGSPPAVSLTHMADSRFCLSGDVAGMLTIWDCETGSLVRTWDAQMDAPNALSASSNGKFIACSNLEESRIWSLSTLDCSDPSFEALLELIIPAPPEANGFIPATCALTFSSDSTTLAIATGFIVDIWKITDSRWQRFNQLQTSLTRFTPHDDAPFTDVSTQGSSYSLRAIRFNYQWLAHHYHKLHVRAPFYLRQHRDIHDVEYEKSLQQCRSAFEWWKLSVSNPVHYTKTNFQLYFSLDCQYVLAPSGIYEVATGQELVNHEQDLPPWKHDEFEKVEVKHFWKNGKEFYQRDGILKSLRPEFDGDPAWIADAEGRLCFWLSPSHFRGTWQWYSRASDGDCFAFISRDTQSNLMFVHIPRVKTIIET
ncbi:hypothetical protein EV360DRAFT_70886 [Lentinula raphanica]|nr:hypothetical protein EV360DRAFT_70886 [Lentinula raphanica]